MIKKSKIIIGILALSLVVSLYLNFKPTKPLYSLNVCKPSDDGGGYTVTKTIDTTQNRNTYLYLMNILEGYNNTPVDIKPASPIPDLILIRNIPSMGISSGIYGIFFDEDISHIIIGDEYQEQQVYKFDEKSTKMLLEYTEFKK